MKIHNRAKGLPKWTAVLLVFVMLVSVLPQTAEAGDTWPFTGDSAQGANQPNVHGYTSGQIANWSPETDPDAEILRSRVPLQQRIAPFAATQANPNLNPEVQMTSVAGDYGNAFIENAPYTNKFAQYHLNFWQYIDYYSYWHGTATAYTPPEYYDELAQQDWQQKWFEFGMLNIPNPTYTDAAHKNGVMSLAGIFFSNNDRGQQTYKQMIVKDQDGNFPVAEKLIEMAKYFGFDGYFVNQEEVGPNVVTADIPDYIAFMKTLQKGGLYVQWYDSLNTATGSNTFARTFNDNNISFLVDKNTQEPVSNSYFFDYGVGNTQINSAGSYLNNLNSTHGTDYNLYDVGFAGLEAGRDRFTSTNGSALNNKLSNGIPRLSIATLGADFVHAGLDEDMNRPWPSTRRTENDYQWMTNLREQLWWSGPNVNPKNTAKSATNTVTDVYADNRYWPGIASVITERSVIKDSNFYTNFNTGHGLSYYVDGVVSNPDEWSNMSLQDIPVTWQWWQETTGSELAVDFDYGSEYNLADTDRYNYEQLGGYNGGSSLVVNGKLDADNFLRLYKTELDVNVSSKLEISYNKPSADDSSVMYAGLILADDPNNVVRVAVPDSGKRTNGWSVKELDLSPYAGKKIAALGLVFTPGQGAVSNYQMNIGQLRVYDGSAVKPAAPQGLAITEAFTDTDEMHISWDLESDYSRVKQYNVYVNDVFVGGKYDGVFYIKHLPAKAGTVKVVPVGADGLEGEAATLAYDLNAAVSNLTVDSKADGAFIVNWTNSGQAAGDINVSVRSLNWITTVEPVVQQITVPAGSSSAVFAGMPVNGDDYIVTVTSGSANPVAVSGHFIDKIVEPYAEAWGWTGNKLSLPMPNTRDWRYMYVYEDGVAKSFPVTYFSGNAANRDKIIRGRTTKASLSFTSSAKLVHVVMEDYAGNRSEPLYLKNHKVSFDANGGEPATSVTQATYWAKLTEPEDVTREGYKLKGWYQGEVKWNFAEDKVTEELVLQAKWVQADGSAPDFVTDLEPSKEVTAGEEVQLRVVTSGYVESIQWETKSPDAQEWSAVPSVASAVYSFTPSLEDDGLRFRVILVGKPGIEPATRISTELTLTVKPVMALPVISSVTVSKNPARVGESVMFTSAATATYGQLSYQWYKNDVLLLDATQPNYLIGSVNEDDAGPYKVAVTNTVNVNGKGYTAAAQSDVILLAVDKAPAVTPAPTPSPVPDSGSSVPVVVTPTPAASPVPSAAVKAVIQPEQFKAAPKDGSITITVAKGITGIELPVNAGELLGQNSLLLQTEYVALSFAPELLQQLKAGFTEAQLLNSSIQVTVKPQALSEAAVKTAAGVALKGEVIDFDLTLAAADGSLHHLKDFAKPVTVKWPAGSAYNAGLLGIYEVGNSGALTYLGGKVVDGMLEVQLNGTGKYALLEYSKSFSDVPASHWAEDTIRKLSAKHLVQGISETEFQPGRSITRAEFVKLMAGVLKLTSQAELSFSDVPAGAWYAEELSALADAGIVSGRTAKRFEPDAEISRQEIVTILLRAYTLQKGEVQAAAAASFIDKADIAPWAADSVGAAAALGMVNGRADGRFVPAAPATRAEAAQFILNYLR